jgi:very-short-patch-repair endonuclease
MPRRAIAAAVEAGALRRVRRGTYVAGGSHPDIVEAARHGGRLDCVSLLRTRGVFVQHRSGLHIQQDSHASRRPSPPTDACYHWRSSSASRESAVTDVVEAVAQAVRCQPPRSAVATLDSAWHLGLVDERDIAEIFVRLPHRYRVLRGLLDARSESGTESLVRLLLRSMGCEIQLQVRIEGVGRVDMVVDGWLIVECDSEEFHRDWQAHKRDRRRDLAAVERGFVPVRLLAEDVLFHPERVRASLERLVRRGPLLADAAPSRRRLSR